MSTRLFIHQKRSCQQAFFHLIRYEILGITPAIGDPRDTCISSVTKQDMKFFNQHEFSPIKGEKKYPTHTFIQDHTVIRATRVSEKYYYL